MSSAANHRKHSHRSNFRARMFNGSRQAVIKPTVRKSYIGQFIRMIRNALKKGDNEE